MHILRYGDVFQQSTSEPIVASSYLRIIVSLVAVLLSMLSNQIQEEITSEINLINEPINVKLEHNYNNNDSNV